MSELINPRVKPSSIRLGLLATTSAIVLATCAGSVQEAIAADRPTVWIEGGWQFEKISGSSDTLVPPLDNLTTTGFSSVPTAANFLGQGAGGFPSFTEIENLLGHSSGAEGSISFQPKESDWIFSVSARYGRAHPRKHLEQRREIVGEPAYITVLINGRYLQTPHYTIYANQAADNTEAHAIIDFQVGRDVGLGLFGKGTESILSFGARYVHMNLTSDGHSYASPAVAFYHVKTAFAGLKYGNQPWHQNSATILQRYSDLHAIGPALSWSNTTGLWGKPAEGQLAFDWGMNAAVLFGRQRVKIHHNSDARMFHGASANALFSSTHNSANRTETHRVIVPNLGAFAGLSFRFPNVKVSAGYRTDFFLGAMDRGLDTQHSVTTGFDGPYASVSIGLGG